MGVTEALLIVQKDCDEAQLQDVQCCGTHTLYWSSPSWATASQVAWLQKVSRVEVARTTYTSLH